jgi:hypothetical protein
MQPITRRQWLALAGSSAVAPHLLADSPKTPRFEFTRLIAHWAEYSDNDYLDFVRDAKPEVCQIGFYGGHFYSLVHTADYKGYPAHFPVQGIAECGKWFQERNVAIHKLGAKVVGHFNVSFLVGEPESKDGPRGFFKFYRDLWDENDLGPKPVKDPLDLISRNADGTPMASKQYSIGMNREYTACLANPHWRAVMKAWIKRGLARGVDGFMANYFYRHNCLCKHCDKSFREYLANRFTAAKLAEKFEIKDVKGHKFTEIIGWHDPKDSTPLRREMLRWSQITCKQCFDEVFIQYGRSIKPDLIVAQWNHLGDFSQISGDERCLLPSELWGKDESYLWYSTGSAAFYTDLSNGFLGEGTLQARYIRGAFDDKPYTLGKYESTRTRVSIAEMAANGGAAMGFYTNFKNPEARKEIVRYYRFLEKYDAIFKSNKPHAEVLLLFPRSKVHAGNVEAVERFKQSGLSMLNSHVLFDILPDDMLTADVAKRYRYTLDPTKPADELMPEESKFTAPQTVRVSASIPAKGGEVDLHFVNYNRIEPAEKKSAGGGIKDEKPIPAEGITADLRLPEQAQVHSVTVVSPEAPDGTVVKFTMKGSRVQFSVPKFLVYAVARIQLTVP